jgi:dephospho-CoA kinase
MIFSDKAAKSEVEKILHGSIISNINEMIACNINRYDNIVIDAPLLFEAGLDKICDKIIVVWVPYDIQSKRLASRDGLNEEQIKKRIASQMSLEKKAGLADFVIKNTSSKKDLKKRTEDLYKLLTSKQK